MVQEGIGWCKTISGLARSRCGDRWKLTLHMHLTVAAYNLRRFNGVLKSSFGLFLKECEWRFNTGSAANHLISLKKLTRTR